MIAATVAAGLTGITGCSDAPERIQAPAHPTPVVWGFTDNIQRDEATRPRKLRTMRAIGVTMVRFDLGLDASQERAVRAARAQGLRVMGVLYGPRDPEAYADHVARVVRRFAPLGVHHYEIWNEPNVMHFWPTADDPQRATREYMALVRAAYPRIKAIDPRSVVLVGALARREFVGGRPNDWVAAMYDEGLSGNFDAISVHPYTFPGEPDDDTAFAFAWRQVVGPWDDRNPSVRELMVERGDGEKRVWFTEFAAPTGGDPHAVDEARQSVITRRAARLAQTYPWLGGFLWYSLRDSENGDEQYGLLRADWTPKPALARFAHAVRVTRRLPAGLAPTGANDQVSRR